MSVFLDRNDPVIQLFEAPFRHNRAFSSRFFRLMNNPG